MDVNNQGLNIPSNLQNLDVRDELLSTEVGGGPSGAYSLRDLTGNNLKCVKVRRMQDNAVKDISCGGILTEEVEDFAIGQDVLNHYNSASYSGDDSFWRANNPGQLDLGAGAFSIKCDVVFTDSFNTNKSRLCQTFDSSSFFAFTTSTNLLFKINGQSTNNVTLSQTLELGRLYNVEILRDSSDVISVKIDGTTVGTKDNASGKNDGQVSIGRIAGFRLRGFAKNWNFNNGQHIYAGDGIETSNWLDTGSGTTTNLVKANSNGGSTGHNLVAFTGQGINAFVDTWFDQSGAFSIKCDVVFTDSFNTNKSRLCQTFDSSSFFAFTTSTNLLFKINGQSTNNVTLSQTLELGRLYNVEILRDSSDVISVKIDGTTVGTKDNASGKNDGQVSIGRIAGFRLRGFAKNWNFNNGQHIYAGDGIETSNWLDTGSGTTTNLVKANSNGGSTGHNLVAFTGQGINAFVDTWFDQSGNERHADQSDMDSQPFIIKDGSITTLESKPTLDFNNRGDGTKGGLETSYDISSDGSLTSYSAFAVYDHINATGASAVFSSGSPINASTTYGGLMHFAESSGNGGLIRTSHQTNGNSTITKVTPRSGFHHSVGFNISTNYYSSSSHLCKLLGFTSSEDTSPVLPQAKDANDGYLRLGVAITTDGTDTYVNHMNGVISEVIIYESDKRSDNTAFENNLTSFYGTPS